MILTGRLNGAERNVALGQDCQRQATDRLQ